MRIEAVKARANLALATNLYFWRARGGREVDLLVERGETLVPVEIKSGQTVAADFFHRLAAWCEIAALRRSDPFP